MDAGDQVEDAGRVRTLHATGLLTPEPVPLLDRVTGLAMRWLETPGAMVSMIDADRQVVVAAAGSAAVEASRESPLSQSMCLHVVVTGVPLIVPDVRADERWSRIDDARRGEMGAYAGMPLRAPAGHVLGTLCVINDAARSWDADLLGVLADLAAVVEAEIALRLARAAQAALEEMLDDVPEPFLGLDDTGAVIAWNAAAERRFGWTAGEALHRPVEELIGPPDGRRECVRVIALLRQGDDTVQRHDLTCADRSGARFPAELIARPSQRRDGGTVWPVLVHDLGDRQTTQNELEEERTFLAALLDNLNAGVVACDNTGEVMRFNEPLRQVLGTDPKKVGLSQWPAAYGLFAADGRRLLAPHETPLARALAGEHFDGMEMVVHAPGRPAYRFSVNGGPVETPGGRRLGAMCVGHDITEAHRLEALRAAHHAAVGALAEGGDPLTAVRRVIAAVCGALEWPCGEFWRLDEEDDRIVRAGSWSAPDRDLSAFTGPEPLDFARGQGLPGAVWDSGDHVWVADLSADPEVLVRDREARRAGLRAAIGMPVSDGRRLLGVLLFFADTPVEPQVDLVGTLEAIGAYVGRYMQRHRAEELAHSLRATRRHFDQVVAQIDDYVSTWEITPDGHFQAVYASPSTTGLLGRRIPDGADMDALVARHIHPDDREILMGLQAAMLAGEPAQAEFRVIGLDGVTRWIWTRAAPRREGNHLFMDTISSDITERHDLAEKREILLADEQRQVRRLQRLDRLKDELMAMVSHELRNPIGVIRGYAEMLREASDLPAEYCAFIEVIDRKSGHLQHLVDDLLDLTRLETGRMTIDRRTVWLTRLIQQTVDDQRAAAAAKNLDLVTELAPYVRVYADPLRLRQVLDNLLSNAIKYTPEGGTVTVSTGPSGEDRDDAGPRVTVSVADTGIGIPADEYEHLFSRFFRATSARAAGIGGTGLGLAITKAIVTAHGGTITAAPREEGGTVFTVCLPTDPPHSP
ncbi:ATP-binding protein [Spirillospora albida]|uniref:ATP-binding protein n=1 Tax=Spirillospora albida TaxID=58123 RepID=UPI00055C7AEC|nr:ATP-binding protein [Spirillospora albida]